MIDCFRQKLDGPCSTFLEDTEYDYNRYDSCCRSKTVFQQPWEGDPEPEIGKVQDIVLVVVFQI